MAEITTGVRWGRKLVSQIVCPNCWASFAPEDVLFIAKHTDLLGDTVAGDDEYLRFMPRRFALKGEAIDPRGLATSDMACPKCHLPIPECMLEIPPLFISIVGSPASGKTYFLTAMTWELRRMMPRATLSFSDADPVANSAVHEYEHTLFFAGDPNQLTEIRKTQTDDPKLHRRAKIDGVTTRFPIPLQFTVWPTPEHPRFSHSHEVGRVMVMYDNAGEDFIPGHEEASSATIRHLARSNILFVLFDPTQEPRFRDQCSKSDPQVSHGLRPGVLAGPKLRQETILKEATVRIRRYLGLPQDRRLRKPLIVVVAKFDILQEATGISIEQEPYTGSDGAAPFGMDLGMVENTSDRVRDLFRRVCPEFVATAESFSEAVRYIPISSLGRSPEYVSKDSHGFYGIRPKDIRPKWVTVPLMYILCKWAPGLIGVVDQPS
jgi:hypothetical protein